MISQQFGKFYRWHRWLGYFLAAHLLLIFLSGIILVFRDELSPKSSEPSNLSPKLTLQEIAEISQKENPKDRLLAISMDDEDPMRVTVRMGQDGSTRFRGSKRIHFDRRIGHIEEGEKKNPILDTILVLHREFLLGFYGKLYVGIIGILFLFSLLSGLFIYGPTTKLRFGTIRRGFSRSLTWIDAHKFLGAACLAWLLLVALSGVLLSFSGQLLRVYQYTTLKKLEAAYPGTGHDAMTSAAAVEGAEKALRDRGIEGEISFISFPGSEFSTAAHYIFVIDEPSSWTKSLKTLALVDAQSLRVDEVLHLPLYLRAAVLAEPLHFGNYGGLTLKIVWSLLGGLGVILIVSSLMIAFEKNFRPAGNLRTKERTPQKRSQRPYLGPAVMSFVFLVAFIGVLLTDGSLKTFWAATLFVPLAFIAFRFFAPSLNSKA